MGSSPSHTSREKRIRLETLTLYEKTDKHMETFESKRSHFNQFCFL